MRQRKSQKLHNPFILLLLFIPTLILLVYVLNKNTKKRPSVSVDNKFSTQTEIKIKENKVSSENPEDLINLYITPTTIPSSHKGWNTFIYPTRAYSFNYPDSWQVEVYKNRYVKEDMYDVYLYYFADGQKYKIYFMQGGRGGPYYDYQKIEDRLLAGKNVRWTKMYRNNKLFEAVVTFPNGEFSDYFIGLYIYFPPTHQDTYEELIDKMISSLK